MVCPARRWVAVALAALSALMSAVQVDAFTTALSRAPHSLFRVVGKSQHVFKSQVQERVERTLTKSPPSSSSTSSAKPAAAAASFGSLPWSGSVTGEGKEQLLYMPFLEWQLRHLHKTGSKVTEVPLASEIRYKCSETKPAHVGSLCYSTEEFRRVRMTYMDAGKGVQVFNSVWYPHFDCDAPLLGIDLLMFGGHKFLAVVDFQPLSHEPEYKAKYLDHLADIKARYPALCESMSGRYYEDTRWFSEHMLFGRLENHEDIATTLMPAFQEYVSSYTEMVGRSRRSGAVAEPGFVRERQRDYDIYNMERDPAGKLFESYFGEEWTHEYMRFLFELV